MRYISKIRKKRFDERISFDKVLQLWFNYHFFFFQSLIFRGLKLRAFSLFILIKLGLKSHKFLEINQNENSSIPEILDDFSLQNHDKSMFFFDKVFSFESFLVSKCEEEQEFLKITEFSKFFFMLKNKCSLRYIWMFFDFFFFKKLTYFFFFSFFFKLFFFHKKLFFFSDPDYFFLSFLKNFFIIWFSLVKNRLNRVNLRIFFYKKNSKCIKFPFFRIYYLKKFYFFFNSFFSKYFFFFKLSYFFKNNLFIFLENKWFFTNQEFGLATTTGVFRHLNNWNGFFSFFLYNWLLEAQSLKNLFIKQDFFIDELPVFDPSFVFFLALLKITPILVLKPIPMGSVNYEMPFPITYWRRISYATRWIINLLKRKSRVISVEGVVSTIINTLFDEGMSIEKKDEVYSLVSLNRHLLRHKVMRR